MSCQSSRAQKQIPIFRRLAVVVVSAILLTSTPGFTSAAHATNCSAITGGSISASGNNWLLQWNALPDRTNVDYLLIFATSSGVGLQNLYNNVDGYQWSYPINPALTSYTISISDLLTFTTPLNLEDITFIVRKDNNSDGCYPLTTLGQITLATAPAAPTFNSVTAGDRRVTVAFTEGANNGAAITDYEYSLNGGSYTSSGTTTSPFTITGLSGRASYSVAIKARNSVGLGSASSSLTATTTDAELDASEAAAAEAARVAAAAAEAARVAAEAEAARRANEQRQMGDLSSVLPLINELINEIEKDLKSISAPKKKSSSLLSKKCVQGNTVKNVKKGANCPKGFVKAK